VLVLDGVSAGYGPYTVLRDVDLVVPTGTVVALLGANGAGKTTLLRTIAGLLRPSQGRILLDDQPIGGLTPYACNRRGICLVPEGRAVFPPLTIRENITLFSPPKKERESLDKALEAFPALRGRLSEPAAALSGGQQQMLALTRAYVSDARLIMLDEVSMGLAPIVVDEIFEFLGRLAARGAALLLVEQYVNKALAAADYAYILSRGTVSFAGDVGELNDQDVFSRYLGVEV
jgi:branched-chain amino acid transport system ATP-binding protein